MGETQTLQCHRVTFIVLMLKSTDYVTLFPLSLFHSSALFRRLACFLFFFLSFPNGSSHSHFFTKKVCSLFPSLELGKEISKLVRVYKRIKTSVANTSFLRKCFTIKLYFFGLSFFEFRKNKERQGQGAEITICHTILGATHTLAL